MTADSNLERRVARLENDTHSMYEMLASIRRILRRHDKRFDRIDQRLDGHDQRFDRMDQRFDRMDQRFDRMDLALAAILQRLPKPTA